MNSQVDIKWADLRAKAQAASVAEANVIHVYRDLGEALILISDEFESERAMLGSDRITGLGLSRASLRNAIKVHNALCTPAIAAKVEAGEITSLRQTLAAIAPPKPKPKPKPTLDQERKKLELGIDARAHAKAQEMVRNHTDARLAEAERKIEQAERAIAAARFSVTPDELRVLKKVFAPTRTLEQDTALQAQAILERIAALVVEPRQSDLPASVEELDAAQQAAEAEKVRAGAAPVLRWVKDHGVDGNARWRASYAGVDAVIAETDDKGVKDIWVGGHHERRKTNLKDAQATAKTKLAACVIEVAA